MGRVRRAFFEEAPVSSLVLQYFPLRLGNEWIYKVRVGTEKRMMAFRVSCACAVGHGMEFVIESNMRVDACEFLQREFLLVEDGDIFLTGVDNTCGKFRFEPRQPLLREPLAPGVSWSWSGTVRDILRSCERCARVCFTVWGWENVDTPAGSFAGLRVDSVKEESRGSGAPMRTIRWYARGTGMVKEVGETGGKLISVATLERCTVNRGHHQVDREGDG